MTERFTFKGVNWAKIGRGALVAVAGAILTYATTAVTDLNIPAEWLPIVTAVFGVLANVVRKWASATE